MGEFEFRPDGKLRYANNSNYKNDTMIRKEAYVHQAVMDELRRVIEDSEIMAEDDALWPQPDRVGRQELEIVIGDEHISFTTSKIGSLVDVNQSRDPDGLRCFYYLVQNQVPGVLSNRAAFQDQANLVTEQGLDTRSDSVWIIQPSHHNIFRYSIQQTVMLCVGT